MPQRTVRYACALSILALVSGFHAFAQSSTSDAQIHSWQSAQSVNSSEHKLVVVTLARPQHRRTCRVQSFTSEKLVCAGTFGHSHTYSPEQVLALILPGDDGLRVRIVLALNAGIGTAIWGTVVLATVCPACAVGTGIAALLLFSAAGATLIADGQSDRLLYLAPRQRLTGKLRFVGP